MVSGALESSGIKTDLPRPNTDSKADTGMSVVSLNALEISVKDFADNIAALKTSIDSLTTSLSSDNPTDLEFTPPEPKPLPVPSPKSRIAFALDIDGVLIGSKGRLQTLLPGALASLQHLQTHKIPFVFLTNRLYDSDERAHASLSHDFPGIDISPNQIIYRITPFKLLLRKYRTKTILVVDISASADIYPPRQIAQRLGFEDVFTAGDFYEVWPQFAPKWWTKAVPVQKEGSRATELLKRQRGRLEDGPDLDISAIFVFCGGKPVEKLSPNRLLIDILKAKNEASGGDKQVKHLKIFYDTSAYDFEKYRRGLRKAWKDETGAELLNEVEIGGKPSGPMFDCAEVLLVGQNRELHGEDAEQFETIIMVGDTPSTDIAGPKSYTSRLGVKWKTVLLDGTGVWSKEKKAGPGLHYNEGPDVEVNGIREAVEWGIEQTEWEDCEDDATEVDVEKSDHKEEVEQGHDVIEGVEVQNEAQQDLIDLESDDSEEDDLISLYDVDFEVDVLKVVDPEKNDLEKGDSEVGHGSKPTMPWC